MAYGMVRISPVQLGHLVERVDEREVGTVSASSPLQRTAAGHRHEMAHHGVVGAAGDYRQVGGAVEHVGDLAGEDPRSCRCGVGGSAGILDVDRQKCPGALDFIGVEGDLSSHGVQCSGVSIEKQVWAGESRVILPDMQINALHMEQCRLL